MNVDSVYLKYSTEANVKKVIVDTLILNEEMQINPNTREVIIKNIYHFSYATGMPYIPTYRIISDHELDYFEICLIKSEGKYILDLSGVKAKKFVIKNAYDVVLNKMQNITLILNEESTQFFNQEYNDNVCEIQFPVGFVDNGLFNFSEFKNLKKIRISLAWYTPLPEDILVILEIDNREFIKYNQERIDIIDFTKLDTTEIFEFDLLDYTGLKQVIYEPEKIKLKNMNLDLTTPLIKEYLKPNDYEFFKKMLIIGLFGSYPFIKKYKFIEKYLFLLLIAGYFYKNNFSNLDYNGNQTIDANIYKSLCFAELPYKLIGINQLENDLKTLNFKLNATVNEYVDIYGDNYISDIMDISAATKVSKQLEQKIIHDNNEVYNFYTLSSHFYNECMYFEKEDNGIITCKGTKTMDDALVDINFKQVQLDDCFRDLIPPNIFNDFYIHKGFQERFLESRKQITHVLDTKPIKELIITGHSLGGSVASIIALYCKLYCKKHNKDIRIVCITYEQAAVFNINLSVFVDSVVKIIRVVNTNDIVPKVPDYKYKQTETLWFIKDGRLITNFNNIQRMIDENFGSNLSVNLGGGHPIGSFYHQIKNNISKSSLL